MKKENLRLKPFVKWAGGKGQLLTIIRKTYPDSLGKRIKKYAEPFIGGGAVFLDIISTYDLEQIYISDINKELINTYKAIQNHVEKLIDVLLMLQNEYLSFEMPERKVYYYEKRNMFNSIVISDDGEINIEKAALFIFLNKTCFNGLYRVNKKGLFNVPMGSYKNPTICDIDNLRNLSVAIKNVTIVYGDYRECMDFVDEETFVYIDPPYRPLSETASFTSYTENLFDDKAQIKLAEFVSILDSKGAYVIVSNSDPKNVNQNDCFFDSLYKNYMITRVEAKRMINCNSESRGKISELLITNFNNQNYLVPNDKTNAYYINDKIRGIKMRDFDEWLSKFKLSISGYDYYINFDKVIENVEKLKIELNILNSLIGSKNISLDFECIIERYPETLKCIPLLLAVRSNEIYAQDEEGAFIYNFKKMNYSIEQYKTFMYKTGLFDLIANHLINNLVDYALGVETGLDSNGRKNRGGHQMEDLVEGYIKKAGFKKDISYFKEMYLADIEKKWNIDLSALSNKGKARKRFDFVVKTNDMVYAIETNFYGGTGGGSKLNETARSYKMLAQESYDVDGFTFVWFTDGTAWRSARGNLRETFDILDTIYNINDMENDIMSELFI